MGHLRLLNSLQSRIKAHPKLQNLPLARVCLLHLDLLSKESVRGWTPASHFRYLTAMDGAFNKLGKFALNFQGSIQLKRFPEWSQAMSSWDLLAKQNQPINLPAATPKDLTKALSVQADPEIKAALMLLWLLAARKGDVLNLHPESVKINPDGRLLVFIKEGKGVKARKGAYHLASYCPIEWRQDLQKFLNSRMGQPFLFRVSLKKSNELNRALQAADSTLTCRAVRRGAAQAMAKDPKVTEATIMSLTGHKSVETLHRYLGWNKVNESAHLASQTAARNNLAPSQWLQQQPQPQPQQQPPQL